MSEQSDSTGNLPCRITIDMLRRQAAKIEQHPWPVHRAHLLAITVLAHYLGPKWIDTYVLGNDRFFRCNTWTSNDDDLDLHFLRVLDLGETIFNLQNIEGLSAPLSQLRNEKRIESAIAELEVGALLTMNRKAFRFKVPTQKLGEDYDNAIRSVS